MDYYIEDGVPRAVAARAAKLQAILATLHEAGKPPSVILVPLDRLHSPKTSISQSAPRYIRAMQGMSSPAARARVPAIDVQLLGEPRQSPTVPLAQVALEP